MSRRTLVIGATIGILAITSGLASVPAAAHEHVIVGTYELIVGWRTEPAIVDVLNGLDLGILHHLLNGSTEPVAGVEGTLSAILRTGSDSVVKVLAPQFGRPGWYTFDVIPTVEGAYSVRLVGSVNGTAVNVSVNLDPVGPRSDVEFPPATGPTPADLQAQIVTLRAQLGTALAVAVVGFAVGALGIVVGAIGIAATRKARRGP